jgi:phosphate:Na+ symporter
MLFGGLSLFIFGMGLVTEGLQKAGGSGLKSVLSRAGRSPVLGILLGTGMGAVAHSATVMVMLVGFVNAGLLTLTETIPAMLGANVGTSLAMQAVSLHLGDYCYFAIAGGFMLSAAARSERTKFIGRAIMGFGLLFLGMEVMSDAIRPHRAALQPLLAAIDSERWWGILLGVGISAGLTAVWQSSGATIGMCFALADAGIFNNASQVFPIVVGAHIGTCATALLGSIGTNIEARRTAFSHLLFNLVAAVLILLARPLILKVSVVSSHDLIHQTANMNTFMMTCSALLFLPFTKLYARLVRFLTPSRMKQPKPSFLREELLDRPERAIAAAIDELRRAIDVCLVNHHLLAEVMLLGATQSMLRQIKRNEDVVNEIKANLKLYFSRLTRHKLSRRQIMLMQEILRCMSDIERIGDHIDKIADISVRREKYLAARFDEETLNKIFSLYRKTGDILALTRGALYSDNTDAHDYKVAVAKLATVRADYEVASHGARGLLGDEVSEHRITQIAALFFREYLAAFDRIVKHTAAIAIARQRPDFVIKDGKLDRAASPAPDIALPAPVDIETYLRNHLKSDM